MKSTFSVIYYLKRQVVKKDGTVPVMGRITVDGSQTQFSCKLTVDPKLWDTKGGRVTGRSAAALETNRMLDKMRVRINRHYQEIMERDNFVTAEKVKNAFLGLEHRYHTLMQVYRRHNEDYEKQVEAGMKAKGTLEKYRIVYKHLQEFLDIRYHVKDIALKELTPAFISDFEMFLRTDKHCCTNTVWLYVCPLRTMVFIAINNEWLTRDPFREYEIKKEETTRSFLTKEEIRLLMDGKLKNAKQELYRDLYLFCAFTGLSFSDMRNLTEENIRTYFDEHEWININRQKTGVVSNIENNAENVSHNIILRTHTSSVQSRVMENTQPPIRIICPGRVYRNEAISYRAHAFFHQVEALFIDRNVSFTDLKQALLLFAQEMFGKDTKIRLRPSYFPFTEPSAEMDISCNICGGKGCPFCKGTGWVEILGCGMVDPNVLELNGIDSKIYSGYALGMGIERIANLKYRVNDLRLFSENDTRFLKEFEAAY